MLSLVDLLLRTYDEVRALEKFEIQIESDVRCDEVRALEKFEIRRVTFVQAGPTTGRRSRFRLKLVSQSQRNCTLPSQLLNNSNKRDTLPVAIAQWERAFN